MIIFIVLICNFILNIYLIIFYESILVNQYYSIKRYIKVVFFLNTYQRIIPLHFKITRRNRVLFFVSLPFGIIIPFPLSFLTVLIGFFITLPYEINLEMKYYQKAKEKLSKLNLVVIGITGSYGKTTLKNYLSCYLSTFNRVYVPKGNINTPKGIAKYINDTCFKKEGYLILELGIDEVNGMDAFSRFLHLDYAFITSIGENHLSTFGNRENIYKGKIKIADLLKNKKMLFLNKEDKYLAKYEKECMFYRRINGMILQKDENGIEIKVKNKLLKLNLYNDYSLLYLGAIKSFSELINHTEKMFFKGIKNIKQIHRRQEVKKLPNGYLINDSYNSNIESIKSSLHLLSSFKGISYIITSGLVEQGRMHKENNIILGSLLKGRNVIFVGNKRHILLKNASCNKLYIVKNMDEAYSLLENIKYNNLLIFPCGERIHLI